MKLGDIIDKYFSTPEDLKILDLGSIRIRLALISLYSEKIEIHDRLIANLIKDSAKNNISDAQLTEIYAKIKDALKDRMADQHNLKCEIDDFVIIYNGYKSGELKSAEKE